MDTPLISIIIPSWNYAQTLPEAVQSALAQDYPNFEIIILDNASTDQTPEILATYQGNPKITCVRHYENIGMNANFNYGWSLAKGEYTVFLCADDILLPGFLTRALSYLQLDPTIDLVYSSAALMKADGTLYGPRMQDFPAAHRCGQHLFPWLLASNGFIMLPTLLISRKIYEKYGSFDGQLCGFDYEIMLRWAAQGLKVAYVPELWAAFRIHKNQRSGIERFTKNGAQAFEYCATVERYLSAEHAPKLRFFEESIKREALRQQRIVLEEGFVDDDKTLQLAVEHITTRLNHIQAQNAKAPFEPKVSVIVPSNGNYACLERSLLSLTDQSHTEWEAIVVSQPGIHLQPLLDRLDARGRITSLRLVEAQSRAHALNAALRIAQGNVFSFLRAGNIFGPYHLEHLMAEYRLKGPQVMLSNVGLEVVLPDQHHVTFENTLSGFSESASLFVAPTHCLEALSFSRLQLDQRYYFPDCDHHFPEWEYLLHYTLSQNNVPIHHWKTELSVLVYAGFAHELLSPSQMMPLYDSLYARYPTTDPTIVSARENYLRNLQRFIETAMEIMASPERINEVYREIYQASRRLIGA